MNSMREVKKTRFYFKIFDHKLILPDYLPGTKPLFVAIKYCGARERKKK